VVQARNSPNRPVLITMGDPHSWHFSSLGLSGAFCFLSDWA